jgi:hypothetical protein
MDEIEMLNERIVMNIGVERDPFGPYDQIRNSVQDALWN